MRRENIDPEFLSEARRCAKLLGEGNIILYPADTIWGLGCDASNKGALARLMDLKKRPEDKSFITLVSSWRMLQNVVADIPEIVQDVLEFSTEPMTIIYPKANPSYAHLCSKDGKIAVRMIEKGLSHLIMEQLRKPLISTSANFSGEPSPVHFEDISDELIGRVDGVASERLVYPLTHKPSRVLMVEMDGRIKILR